jgi:outer membrane protein assembly factor BamB
MVTHRFKCTLALLFSVVLLSAAAADNWPRFRGPNGTGLAVDDKIPITWSEKENMLWKVRLPGEGNSSPVIWGDRLYVQSASEDGSSRDLLCLDAKTGKTIWTRSVSGAKAHTHDKNTLASSTPAVDGKRVYVSYWDGKGLSVQAYDLDGKPLWSRDLGSFLSQHGAGASPVVYGDKVYMINDQDTVDVNSPKKNEKPDPKTLATKAILYCLDAGTGNIVWQKSRIPYRTCYGAPLLWERADGSKDLLVASTMQITGYDPDTGKINWEWKWEHPYSKFPLRVTGSPTVSEDMVFAQSGDGGGARYMVALKVGGSLTRPEAKLAWDNKKEFPYVPCMILFEGKLFSVSDKGVAGCVNPETGKFISQQRLPDAYITASPVLAGGKIYVASEGGDVFVLAADSALKLLATNSMGERIRATPAVANNRLFIRGQHYLYCIGE